MQFKYKCLLIIAPLIFILDQLTKFAVMKHVEFGSKIAVIPGYFDIVHYSNSGAAFGILSGADAGWRTPFFYIVSVLALVFIGVYIYKLKPGERAMAFALSLVVGGIFGNSLDRIRFGSVTDFLSAHVGDKVLLGIQLEWPAFNVADSAITVAMALLILQALSRKP